MAGDAQRDAAVLRQALFGDVEVRHDLYARHQRGVQAALGLDHVAQLSVDAIAHQRAALEGFDVDVGRAFAHRLGEQRVDELDDRGIVFRFEQIGDLWQQFGKLLQIDVLADVLDELLVAPSSLV